MSNVEYHRRQTVELNPVRQDIHNFLEEAICKALTGQETIPEVLYACQRI